MEHKITSDMFNVLTNTSQVRTFSLESTIHAWDKLERGDSQTWKVRWSKQTSNPHAYFPWSTLYLWENSSHLPNKILQCWNSWKACTESDSLKFNPDATRYVYYMVELDYVRIKGDQYIINEYTENTKHNIHAYMDKNSVCKRIQNTW